MKRKQNPITSYFSKKTSEATELCTGSSGSESDMEAVLTANQFTSTSMDSASATCASAAVALSSELIAEECDIGKLLHFSSTSLHTLTREQKYRILVKNPDSNPLAYPRTRPYDSGSYRQFQPSWLEQYPWLHYSPFCDGVFCRACALFAPEKVHGHVLGQFVTKPFNSWVNHTQKMNSHSRFDYHLVACTKMQGFLTAYENPTEAVSTRLDRQAEKQLEENKKVIESLFKVVIILGKQGLAFRGHRDDGVDWLKETDEEEVVNQGNFIELVRFRAETDTALRNHLECAPKNAKYTSKTIQNQLIDIVGNHIRSEILDEIKKSKYYSVLADEVTDVSNREQLSISFRYVLDGNVKEVFCDFIEMERITGKELAGAILHSLATWEVPLHFMRGQCYDGASNMAGARSGCSAVIKEKAPLAIYHHCAAHRLNLAIVSACKIAAFRNTESFIGEMARFFGPKRQRLLDRAIDAVCPDTHAKRLKDTCKTRWIQHIDSYTVFLELLPAINLTFKAMISPASHGELGTWNWDAETVIKATGFMHQLESSSFLICMNILLECLTRLRGLTTKLQMEALDVLYAYNQVQQVIADLKSMREKSGSIFSTIFKETTMLAKHLHGEDFELKKPRVASRQVHRDNVQVLSVEDFFRVTLFNEFLSHLISELEERFLNCPTHSAGLLELMPKQCCEKDEASTLPPKLQEAAQFYANDLPHFVMLPQEYRSWVSKWKEASGKVPAKLVDVYEACDVTCYPNIRILLQLALTLPITSCECERSFSQLKLIKTARRSTVSASRLSSLSLIKINRDRCDKLYSTKINSLIQAFAATHSRRIKLPFMLAD